MKKSFLFIIFFISSYLYGQSCNSNAGENMEVCGGVKVGAELRAMMPWIGKKKLIDSDKK